MKATRLASTTDRYARPALERAVEAGDREVRRVEALDAIEGDRQRSLRQELAEADPHGGKSGGNDNYRREAHDVAERLLHLPDEAKVRLTRPLLPEGFCVVDEKA